MSATKFTLKYPIERAGETITELNGRRMKVRDMQKFFKTFETDSVKAFRDGLVDMFAVTESVINDLDIEDYAPIQKWFQDFLAPMKTDSEI